MLNKRIMSFVFTSVLGITTVLGGVLHPTSMGSFFEVNADEENVVANAEDTDEDTKDEESDDFSYCESVAGYKISMEADSSAFSEGTIISIKQTENPVSLIEEELPEGRNIEQIVTFDITFWNDGVEIEPEDSSVHISVSLDSEMKKILKNDSAEIQVFHIDDNNKVEEVDCEASKREVSFDADSFSEYAVVASTGILDTIAPNITGLSFSPSIIIAPGEIEVTATATDDLSGVDEIDMDFYNEAFKKHIYVFAYSSYWDGKKGGQVAYSDGKLHGTISIDQYMNPGEYVVKSMTVYDKAKNKRIYGEYGEVLPNDIENKAFVVNNAGAIADLIVSTNTADIANQIKNQKDDAVILVDFSNNTTIKKNVFDEIKGTNRTIVLESEGVQWIFNGKDITKNSKNVDLSVAVNYVKDISEGNDSSSIANNVKDKPTVVLTFASNGTLPGTATVRIKADYAMKQYLGQSGVYVYYVDNANDKMVEVARNLGVTADSFIEFNITHCSQYIMTKGALSNLNMTGNNSNSQRGSSSSSTSARSSSSYNYYNSNDDDDSSSGSYGFAKGDFRTAGKGAGKAEYKKISKSAVRYETTDISDKATKAVVPATVKIGRKTYKVTSIAPKAFAGKKNLKSLTIGKNVKKIGAEAVSKCTKLKTIIVNAKGLTKKNVKNSLKGSSVNTIKVPERKVDSYSKFFTKANAGKKANIKAK